MGLLARVLLPGRQSIPIWLTILLGIVGAIVGNVIAANIGVRHTDGIDWVRHLLQIGVAAAAIALVEPLYTRRGVRR